jgi:hypothetical protein
MMRVVDILYGLPTLLVIILIMVYFRSASLSGDASNPLIGAVGSIDDAPGGMFVIFIGIGVTSWLTASRLVRGIILSLKEQQFIEAAHSVGCSDLRIMTRHLLPNVLGPVIVAETLTIPTYILYEAFLSFIGLGVNPPMPMKLGRHDQRGLQGHAFLSPPGDVPRSGPDHHPAGLQLPGRRPQGRPRPADAREGLGCGATHRDLTRCHSEERNDEESGVVRLFAPSDT